VPEPKSRTIAVPIDPRTRELHDLMARLSRTETVRRVVRDGEAIAETRERAEPVPDPAALERLRDLAGEIAADWQDMTPHQRIQQGDALRRSLRAAEAHVGTGTLGPARDYLSGLLAAEGMTE
jgi:hypothetical protein